VLHQRLTRNLFTGQDEPLTAPLTRDFTEDLGDGRAETFFNKFGGAAAAYSLRALGSYNENVVRVRRESDNTEKDFTAIDVTGGEMARWVNEQPTLPLDLRELNSSTGERDGALIEAAAAYSLRKLKEDFTGDVVEVRRNVDGEMTSFLLTKLQERQQLTPCVTLAQASLAMWLRYAVQAMTQSNPLLHPRLLMVRWRIG
jgi:hypothetical protein